MTQDRSSAELEKRRQTEIAMRETRAEGLRKAAARAGRVLGNQEQSRRHQNRLDLIDRSELSATATKKIKLTNADGCDHCLRRGKAPRDYLILASSHADEYHRRHARNFAGRELARISVRAAPRMAISS